MNKLNRQAFGSDFNWGVSVAAYQIEGAHNLDGKGPSIWDTFSNTKGKIRNNENGNNACEFYHRYLDDLDILQEMGVEHFRFSISWSRVMPGGVGQVNPSGLAFYHNVIDACLARGIKPWITLYHWDLPQALEDLGGWTNRKVLNWFEEFATLVLKEYGDKVKHWMVLNEPMVFVGAGYFLGVHAPGRRGLKNFLPAIHHATLVQGFGQKLIKALVPDAFIGTTFSCSYVEPFSETKRNIKATQKANVLLNKMFLEPALGHGYPVDDLKVLRRLDKYIIPGDEDIMKADFDFIGIQNYTREIIRHSYFTPYIQAKLVYADKRNCDTTLMNWEVYPESIYQILKMYWSYEGVKNIIVTENGSAFSDQVINGEVNDPKRLHYLKEHITQVLRAKKEGVNVNGYFYWTFQDNFEWAEGYMPRFGLVHVDFETQKRIIKSSGKWYKQFLLQKVVEEMES